MNTNLQRRQFVQAAAAAIATAQFPILGANDRIQIGVVGVGSRGTAHIDSYSSLDSDCRIAAVCDVDQAARERAVARIRKTKGYAPKDYNDMRTMFESKDVDAVSIATPNHWHALAAIWGCEAGKHIYVEKPASYNVFEGQQMVAAARKYNRMVQVGHQFRSQPGMIRAIQLLSEGVIGQVYQGRVFNFKRRFSIGHTPDEPVPAGLDWDRFLGPAQQKPYSKNKFAYNWHWFWDTGNADIGNTGVHWMDSLLWGFGRGGWPLSVSSTGGKFVWQDDQETPNTQQVTMDFGDAQLTCDVRNLPTPPEGSIGGELPRPPYGGNLFLGDQGFFILDHSGFQVYKSTVGKLRGDAARGADAGSVEKYEKTVDEGFSAQAAEPTDAHMKNFFEAIRASDYKLLHEDIEIGVRSAAFCHLANISYRVGRPLRVSQSTGRCLGDEQASALFTRDYRSPYVVSRVT